MLASTPFWSVRTLDPSTELAPFTAGRLQAAMNGPHPPTLVPSCRVVRVDRDEDGGYVIIADKNRAATDAEVLCLQVRRPAAGFGVFLQTSTVVVVEAIEPGGAAEQGEITTSMNAVPLPRTVYLYGAQEDFTKRIRALFIQVDSRSATWCSSSPEYRSRSTCHTGWSRRWIAWRH